MHKDERATIWYDEATGVWWWKLERAGGGSASSVHRTATIAAIDLALAIQYAELHAREGGRDEVIHPPPSPRES
jgi:hypothetical protein